MKVVKTISILLLCIFIFTACVTEKPSETAKDTDRGTENTSQPVTETADKAPEMPLTVDFAAATVYRENVTERSGAASFSGSIRLRLTYESAFYGARSAIERPYTRYAESFRAKNLTTSMPSFAGQIATADFNGDKIGDIVIYDKNKLTFVTVKMTLRKKETYVPNETNSYYAETVKTADFIEGAELYGAGDFNGDGVNDLFFGKDGYYAIYSGSENGFSADVFKPENVRSGKTLCGDFDADGLCDIIVLDGSTACVYRNSGDGFSLFSEKELSPLDGEYEKAACADMNCDKRTDVVLLEKHGDVYSVRSLFGDGRGSFGTDSDNKNLYSTAELEKVTDVENFTAGDISGNGAADILARASTKSGMENIIFYSKGEPAYDYSLFGMKKDGKYYLYSGCRWADGNTGGDGDHVMLSESEDGVNWLRHIEKPMFYLGYELGEEGWWTDNTLEPEVLYVDGTYHMYWQCSYVTPQGYYGDKIGYASSKDGVNWERKTDEPAVICEEDNIGFNHEEVIYVPDDPDGKPFWMYTGHFIDGVFRGYIRIRSADPEKFLYSERELTDGFSQIGNQVFYLNMPDGRLFMRITFTEEDEYTVPTFQASKDGLHFTGGKDLLLASVDHTDPRNEEVKNVYFLGVATEDGTGRIDANEDGSFTILYFATCCASSVAPEIFSADGGVGSVTLRFK